jgi:DNA-binding HxlR family transcriptional regulator
VGDKWTLLIVRDLAAGPRRFVELQRVLPGISTEQLRSRLNRMVADGLLTRQRYREVPPRVDYELTERARELMPILGALARWGYDWTWSEPRDGEDVDIGAILRLAPGMLSPPKSLRGRVAIKATGKQARPRDYVLAVRDGQVTIEEPGPDADSASDAQVSGSHKAWIAALGPEGDRSDLEITGDHSLAKALLDGIVGTPARNSRAA